MAYFPMFIDIENKSCLVIGGGKVALRKVEYLRDFGAQVTVLAKQILPEIREMDGVESIEKSYEEADPRLEDYLLVIVATDDGSFNQKITKLCREKKIPVNVVDNPKECSFILPAYLKEEKLLAAFSSGGNSPLLAQHLKEKNREILTPWLGKLNSYLGSLRPEVKKVCRTMAERKAVYKKILEAGLKEKRFLPLEEALKEADAMKERQEGHELADDRN